MSTTAKFSLDNPYYSWPKNPEMDVNILINKLIEYYFNLNNKFSHHLYSLRAKFSDSNSWSSIVITDPNTLLRKLEDQNIYVVFVCLNDLKHSVHVAHLPFLCRLTGTKLVVLKSGSAQELQSYFSKKNLFMFAVSKHDGIMDFGVQFPDFEKLDHTLLPKMSIKK